MIYNSTIGYLLTCVGLVINKRQQNVILRDDVNRIHVNRFFRRQVQIFEQVADAFWKKKAIQG